MNVEKYIFSQDEEFKLDTNNNVQTLKENGFNEINLNGEYEYMKEDFLLYIKAREMIPSNKTNTYFDSCSNRLKNALYKQHIFTVKDLIDLSPLQIMKIPNLGRKCFVELYDFLLELSNDSEVVDNTNLSTITNVEEKLNKIRFINENSTSVTIEFNSNILDTEEFVIEEYKYLYIRLINHICESANMKLNFRERSILMSRFGINEEAKSLQEIGNIHSLSRERVRQLLVRSMKKMGSKSITNNVLLDLEYEKVSLILDINKHSTSNFILFLLLSNVNLWVIKFVVKYYFKSEVDIDKFRYYFQHELLKKQQESIALEKKREFNDAFNQLITFTKKRYITEEDFSRLKTERYVNVDDPEMKACIFNGKKYQCESFLEQQILHKLLINNTFKDVKTQSLKVPHKNHYYYPDFQCLTHDNLLVLIEVKPMLNMCENDNIEKFKSLKDYCEKYGFGYLIIDNRWNSYEHIDEENSLFSKLILDEINKQGSINYSKYKVIYQGTNASLENLLTLIKKYNLRLSFPFVIKR